MNTLQRRLILAFFMLLPVLVLAAAGALTKRAGLDESVLVQFHGHMIPWGVCFIFAGGALTFSMYFLVMLAIYRRNLRYLLWSLGLALLVIAGAALIPVKEDPLKTEIIKLRKGVQAAPKDHGAYELLANAYIEDGQYELALKAFDQALALTPDPAYIYHDRGLLQARAGHYEAAIADLTRAMELRADQPDFVAKTYNDIAVVDYYYEKYAQSAENAAKAKAFGLEVSSEFLDSLAAKGFDLRSLPAPRQ